MELGNRAHDKLSGIDPQSYQACNLNLSWAHDQLFPVRYYQTQVVKKSPHSMKFSRHPEGMWVPEHESLTPWVLSYIRRKKEWSIETAIR